MYFKLFKNIFSTKIWELKYVFRKNFHKLFIFLIIDYIMPGIMTRKKMLVKNIRAHHISVNSSVLLLYYLLCSQKDSSREKCPDEA